jgi:lipopolysaccharide/colanic/teichoic acid biosynthesis glycosyltransferase
MISVQFFIKRSIDFILSLLFLIVLLPIFLVIGVLIKLESRGPVFFRQERIGKNQKRFRVFKFRTMIDNAINFGTGIKTSKNDPRITRIGNILRKTSVDELPQLINVLMGEMSFIGPRPAVDVHLKHYSPMCYIRFSMRPGLSGLAQVNGRGNIKVKKRLVFDVYYVKNFSLWLDFQILLKTFLVVFTGKDIYRES